MAPVEDGVVGVVEDGVVGNILLHDDVLLSLAELHWLNTLSLWYHLLLLLNGWVQPVEIFCHSRFEVALVVVCIVVSKLELVTDTGAAVDQAVYR